MTTHERIQRDRQLRADALKRHEAQHGFVKGFWLATRAMARDVTSIAVTSIVNWTVDRMLRRAMNENQRVRHEPNSTGARPFVPPV